MPNQIDCFRPVTRWAEALSETAAIPSSLAAAFALTRSGRPGPVALSIPNDLLVVIERHFVKRSDGANAGTVYPHINAPEFSDSQLRKLFHLRTLADIGGHGE